MKSETKTVSGLNLNFWKQDEHTIHISIKNPHAGKDSWLTSIESTEKHDGKQMARTHDNLFRDLKAILEANGKWQ
ncbi:hypothetical protein HNQ44_001364 [Planomicrobium koreense]|uniref:Uncharacterized protein n=1 Tax=Planococcus koreensis TaxID=112331 RepID=A0A7W8CQU4_9BACL|nr:hypothetical protein [Planococcus koreensis]MBB5179940.1 hypothetical protein [Planococcus koreensis]